MRGDSEAAGSIQAELQLEWNPAVGAHVHVLFAASLWHTPSHVGMSAHH